MTTDDVAVASVVAGTDMNLGNVYNSTLRESMRR